MCFYHTIKWHFASTVSLCIHITGVMVFILRIPLVFFVKWRLMSMARSLHDGARLSLSLSLSFFFVATSLLLKLAWRSSMLRYRRPSRPNRHLYLMTYPFYPPSNPALKPTLIRQRLLNMHRLICISVPLAENIRHGRP